MEPSVPEKIGAGFLFCCEGEILLLKRSPKSGNPNTLGLPGGNRDIDDPDDDILSTAVRESKEEMGSLPEHKVVGRVLTKRGKRLQKHYTVFLAQIARRTKESWIPQLNEEHLMYVWMPFEEAVKRNDLHPVVQILLISGPEKDQVFRFLEASLT